MALYLDRRNNPPTDTVRPDRRCLAEVGVPWWASHGAAEPMVGMLEACANNASVKFPPLDNGPLEVVLDKGFLCFDSPCPF
eukprot:114246-Pyramimonas_sp.AAC.1